VADLVENQGASIFRVSAASISAALNRGMTPDEIQALFQEHSRTTMPATIERLIRDQAERYGQVRVGRATAYLQVDDPEVLDEIAGSEKLKGLNIQKIAPTIAVLLGADEAAAIVSLRKAGYLPTSTSSRGGSSQSSAASPRFQSQDELMVILRYSAKDSRLVRLHYTEPGMEPSELVFEPRRMRKNDVWGFDAEMGDELEIPYQWISSAIQISDKEARKYYEE
jgi:hypothetical protein